MCSVDADLRQLILDMASDRPEARRRTPILQAQALASLDANAVGPRARPARAIEKLFGFTGCKS